MKQGSKLNKKFAQSMLVLFFLTVVSIIALYVVRLGYEFRIDQSISTYVGFDFWSAAAFLTSNTALVILWMKYMTQVRKSFSMPSIWFVAVVVAGVMLFLLSVCPIGLYDDVTGRYGVISMIHQFSSRTMFVLMLLTAVGLALKVQRAGFRIYVAIYAIYGCAMALMSLLSSWFWDNCLVLEFIYILAYFVMLCILPGQSGEACREKGR